MSGSNRDGGGYRESTFQEPLAKLTFIGVGMEKTVELVSIVNEEARESKQILEDLANQISKLQAIVQPALVEHAQGIRAARMTVVSEVQQALTAMRDVRKFFLESDYEEEMVRLERFVRVCRELQALKEAGVLDAVCDSSLRLLVTK